MTFKVIKARASEHLCQCVRLTPCPHLEDRGCSNPGRKGWGRGRWRTPCASASCWRRSSWSSRWTHPPWRGPRSYLGCRSRCRSRGGRSPCWASPTACRGSFHTGTEPRYSTSCQCCWSQTIQKDMSNKNSSFMINSYLQVWFFSELFGFGCWEVVVRKGGVHCGDEVEEGLPVDGVTEGHGGGLIFGAGAPGEWPGVLARGHGVGVTSVPVLGRGQRLQSGGRAARLHRKLLVQLLLCGDHLAGVTLDPEYNEIYYRCVFFIITPYLPTMRASPTSMNKDELRTSKELFSSSFIVSSFVSGFKFLIRKLVIYFVSNR